MDQMWKDRVALYHCRTEIPPADSTRINVNVIIHSSSDRNTMPAADSAESADSAGLGAGRCGGGCQESSTVK